MKLSLLMVIALSTLVVGCEQRLPQEPDAVISRTQKTYTIVDVNPPKSFKVDIKEVGTNYVYKDIYVSHHCNDWRKLKLGSQWIFTEVVYKGKNSNYVVVEGVKTALCDALRKM